MNTIIVLDTETTSIPNWKEPSESPNQPHLVQLAAHQVDTDAQKIIQTMDVIIKPDGWNISIETTEIHGITTEYANDVGIPEKMALEMFLSLWDGRPRIAFNTTFENRVIRIGTKRYFDNEVIDRWHTGKQGEEWQCMMLASRKIMGGKQPTQAEAYKHFTGKDLEDAHTAIADVNACMEIYFKIKELEANAA